MGVVADVSMEVDRDPSARRRSDITPRVLEDRSNTTARHPHSSSSSSSSSSNTISIKTATAMATMNMGTTGTTRATTRATADNTMTAATDEEDLQTKIISRTTTTLGRAVPAGAGARCPAEEGGR
jgi:hypothetical protein